MTARMLLDWQEIGIENGRNVGQFLKMKNQIHPNSQDDHLLDGMRTDPHHPSWSRETIDENKDGVLTMTICSLWYNYN